MGNGNKVFRKTMGLCGKVDTLQNKKETAQIGGAGNVEAPAPTNTDRVERTL
jgi:hypothetical protein